MHKRAIRCCLDGPGFIVTKLFPSRTNIWGHRERKNGPHQHYRVFKPRWGHFSKALYFDELVEEAEVALAWPQCVPLLTWEDLEGNKPKPRNSAYTSTHHPGPFKQSKPNRKKKTRWGDDSFVKASLAYGRKAYLLWWSTGPESSFGSGTLTFHVF